MLAARQGAGHLEGELRRFPGRHVDGLRRSPGYGTVSGGSGECNGVTAGRDAGERHAAVDLDRESRFAAVQLGHVAIGISG